jgi:hypothetical protein
MGKIYIYFFWYLGFTVIPNQSLEYQKYFKYFKDSWIKLSAQNDFYCQPFDKKY